MLWLNFWNHFSCRIHSVTKITHRYVQFKCLEWRKPQVCHIFLFVIWMPVKDGNLLYYCNAGVMVEGAVGGLNTRRAAPSDFTFYPPQCNFLMIKWNKMQSLKCSLKLLFSASKLSFWVMLARSISFSESLKCQSDPLLCLRGKHLHGKI